MYILPQASLEGVRTRRLMSMVLDMVLVSVVAGLLSVVLFIFTLGLSVFILPSMWPLVGFFYNGLSLSGRNQATPGMRMFGLQARLHDGAGRVPFLNAAAHGVLFYLSWLFPLLFLFTLVDGDKRFLHDILSGLWIVRRA